MPGTDACVSFIMDANVNKMRIGETCQYFIIYLLYIDLDRQSIEAFQTVLQQIIQMNFIIEQAKQYFIGKNYEKAYHTIKENIANVPDSQLALALDVAASSYFMAKQYDTANKLYSQAITKNPNIVDFYISKGATLRCIGNDDEAIEVLEKAAEMTVDPAINYNLRILSKNNLQITAQTQLISENQQYNKEYDKYDGIVPSFLKLATARSDYIRDKEKQIIQQILIPVQNQNQKNWGDHLKKISDMIQMRDIQKNNYGVQLLDQSKQLFPAMIKIIEIYKDINKKIKVSSEKQQLLKRVTQLIKMIKADQSLAKIISQNEQITDQLKIKSEKQFNVYKNIQSFNEAKIKAQPLCQRLYKIGQSDPKIHTVILQNNYLAFINMDFVRNLTPTKTLKQLSNLSKQDGKFIFNLYWFICFKILFNCKQGMNLNQFLMFRQPIIFIYSQFDDSDDYKLQQDQLLDATIYIIQKYNQLFTVKFIDNEKKQIIYKNCQFFKNNLQQIDLTFESILKKKVYVDLLTNHKTNTQAQKEYRTYYGLSDQFRDNIAQNLMLIFYHFREPCKPHQLLVKAMAEMTIQGKDTLNGKESFYANFSQSMHPPRTLLEKVWKKISQ